MLEICDIFAMRASLAFLRDPAWGYRPHLMSAFELQYLPAFAVRGNDPSQYHVDVPSLNVCVATFVTAEGRSKNALMRPSPFL